MRADCSALSRLLKKGARWQWEDAHQKVEARQQRLAAHHREALGLLFEERGAAGSPSME